VPTGEEGLLPWEHVERRLVSAQNYWVITIGAAGTPHASPVWAVWMNGSLYFSCGRETQKARNLTRNPKTTVHLESGQDVVILRGIAQELTDDPPEATLIAAFRAKYDADVIPDSAADLNGLFYVVRPRTAIAWANFPSDVTRWDF